jgi:hypothetical protein
MSTNDSDKPGRRPSMEPPLPEATQDSGSNVGRVLLGGVSIIAMAGVVFLLFSIHHKDYLATQAKVFSRTFITSSPIVQAHLGTVQNMVETKEQHESGKAPGWYLDYKVTGRHAKGVVDLRLTQSAQVSGWNEPVQWNVSAANLNVKDKTVDLR